MLDREAAQHVVAADVELVADVEPMGVDRLRGNSHFPGDFLARHVLGDAPQDRPFVRGQQPQAGNGSANLSTRCALPAR